MFAAHQRFSKVSVNHLFDDRDSEKKNFFWKKVWKKSCILNSKFCTNPE